MKYLSGEEILIIHSQIIDETTGSHGLRDLGLFLSIIEKPKASFGGKDLYLDLFAKAAVYLEAIAKYHVFIDGNKRTSFVSAARFLAINGYDFDSTNKEVEKFIIDIIVKKFDLEKIAAWLKEKSRKI